MKKLLIISLILILSEINSFSQAAFLGFNQEQCGLAENPEYTYVNSMGLCSSHSRIYKIFFNGNLVYEKPCNYLQFYSIDTLFFINDSTGFMVEYSGNNVINKTEDFGRSWKYLGYGAPTFLGFYVINEHNIYLITTANGSGAYITRASDLERKNPNDYFGYNKIDNEVNISDTIYGDNLCNIDTLSFRVKEGTDTISYNIALQYKTLPTISLNLSESQLKIYPNPCSNYIYLPQNILGNGGECKLFNMNRKLVKSFTTKNNSMYVGDLGKGIYLMEIKIDENKIIKKIVKK